MAILRDVLAYISACFWEAISFRQKAKAVLGLIAALAALPLIWAVGGTLEPTAKGVVWIAAWLTTSSVVLMFVFAPFFLWRGARGRTKPLIKLSANVRQQPSGQNTSSKWVQVVVGTDADVPLIDCEVEVVSIQFSNSTLYDEPLHARWSNSTEIRRTLRPGIPQGANLFYTIEGQKKLVPEMSVGKPQLVLHAAGKYRIDVAVHASNADTKRAWFELDYGGDYNSVSFSIDQTGN